MTDSDVVSIKVYIDTCVSSLREAMQQHFDLNDKALRLANEAMLVRLESMNEFREQIKEERANLATKENLVAIYDKLDQRLKPLETSKAVSAGQLKLLTLLPSSIAGILALIALFKG